VDPGRVEERHRSVGPSDQEADRRDELGVLGRVLRLVNEEVNRRLGGVHSARTLMLSVDFAEIEELQRTGNWDQASRRLIDAGRQLERGGADFLLLCTNTMHRTAPELERALAIPFVHIADATADAIKAAGIAKVGLLGTRYTMEQDFYRGRLEDRHRLSVIVPEESERTLVHDVIYNELVLGRVEATSRAAFAGIIGGLVEEGSRDGFPLRRSVDGGALARVRSRPEAR
jgi:aspartate racemase